MKNMMKKMLFVVVVCVSFTLVSHGKAEAAQKITISQMKNVSGKTNIQGERCVIQSYGSGCLYSVSSAHGWCNVTTPLNYSECSSGNRSDTCNSRSVPRCNISTYQVVDGNGVAIDNPTTDECTAPANGVSSFSSYDLKIDNGC